MATKKTIVAKLEELGIEHDAALSAKELQELLPEGALPEEEVEEDEPHKALRSIIEAYKIQNPAKYELKKDEFTRKLGGKLRFSTGTDGVPMDGRTGANGRPGPVQVEVVK